MEGDGATASTPAIPNPIADSLPTGKKHAGMLERLSARHSQASSATRRSESTSSPLQSFLDRFANSKRSIESDVDLCRSKAGAAPADLKVEIDRVSFSISGLERLLAESSYLLPAYEVRTALKTISDLKESLEKVSADLLPRKKFSFKNKATSKDPGELARKPEVTGSTEKIAEETPSLAMPVRESPGFRNRDGVVLVKDFSGPDERDGDFTLSELSSCEVYLRGRFRALFIHRLKNCQVFVGPVTGSILIEDAESCLFMLASHQIRIHEVKETDFYLRVRSRPIVEYCSGVRFGRYRLFYEGIEEDLTDSGLELETGNWANVDDFRWLRAVQSPNWCLIPEQELKGTVNISDVSET